MSRIFAQLFWISFLVLSVDDFQRMLCAIPRRVWRTSRRFSLRSRHSVRSQRRSSLLSLRQRFLGMGLEIYVRLWTRLSYFGWLTHFILGAIYGWICIVCNDLGICVCSHLFTFATLFCWLLEFQWWHLHLSQANKLWCVNYSDISGSLYTLYITKFSCKISLTRAPTLWHI